MIAFPLTMNCLKKNSVVLLLFILLMASCKEEAKKEVKAPEAIATESFIKPPLQGADVPYHDYTVDAAKGDTLIYHTGSIILFPPNAFVDETGKPVTGNVQVKYREFTDPIDLFLSGIPMQYDSAGAAYQFESSGMFDIRAFKDGKPVFVNQANKPEINLATSNTDNKHSLYFLDTVQKKWITKGGMSIIDRRRSKNTDKISIPLGKEILVEPVKPLKASNNSPVLKIEIDPSSFREFAIYYNVRFQVDERKTPFNVKDTAEEWNNLELLKGSDPGSYMAKFSNARKIALYAVKPVFQGEDYNKAIEVFEKEYALYKQQVEARAAKVKADRLLYIKDSIENEQVIAENKKIEILNGIIAKKNVEIERQNEIIRQTNLAISKQNKITAKKNLEVEKQKKMIAKRELEIEKERALNAKRNLEIEKQNEIKAIAYKKKMEEARIQAMASITWSETYRNLTIDGFGVWNCDVITQQKTIRIRATFKDESGKVLDLKLISIINRSVNTIFQATPDNMLLVPDADNMILAVNGRKLVYVSIEEYRKLNITVDTKKQTFIMKTVEEANCNYEYIKSLLKK